MENKKKNIPRRRFEGFTEDWEQRKFGDVGSVSMCKRIFKNETSDGGDIPFYKIGTFGGEPDAYISRELFEEYKEKFSYPDEGDILLSASGTIGRIVEYTGEEAYFQDSNIVWLSHDKSVSNKFLKVLYPTVKWDGIEGSTIKRLYNDNFLKTQFMMPKIEEQERLGEYFEQLDNLITLHQRKLDKLRVMKKSYLSEMFPQAGEKKPRRRFKGFTEDWEQRKWIDVVDISTEMVNPTTGEYDNMPHIAPGNIESFTGRILDNVKTVKEEQLISGKFRFRPDDVVYGKINPQLGKYFYATVNGLTSADAYVFNGKNGLKQKFLFALLQTSDFFKYSVSVSKRSGMPKINRDELNAYSFLMPSEEEQDKIGSYLLQLDNLITLHQRKLEKLKNIKQAYLNEMFV